MEKMKQFSYAFITINENAKSYTSINEILNNLILDNPNLEYSYILHEKDEDIDNLHYHITIYSKGKPKRFKTWVNLFEGAHIEEISKARYKRTIQYLIHKNNPEKKQYNFNDIVSNINRSELDDILLGNGYDFKLFEPNKVYDYIMEFEENGEPASMETFIRDFGLEAIRNYYFILKDILKSHSETLLLNYKRNKKKPFDYINILWERKQEELRLDYRYALSVGVIKKTINFDDFLNEEYKEFISDIERGYYDKEIEEIKKTY